MATFNLTQSGWTEIVALGGDACQMITVMEGVAMVSVGDPDGDGFLLRMDSAGHRQNAIGPRVPVYARADTPSAKVSVGEVANQPAFLADDQAIVTDADEIALGEDTVTLAVAGGTVLASLPADQAVVHDADEFAATGGTVTISVAEGVATAEFTPDP